MPTFGGIVVSTGSEASGRRTLLEVVDELARPIDASDTTVRALCGDAFRAAVRTMNRKGNWPWEYQEEDMAITANNAYSSVTSAVKKPLSMHLLATVAGAEERRLHYIPYDIFREKYTLNITSEPYCYTLPNLFETGQVRWYPTPGAAYNARFAFHRVTPAPQAESETVEVPDYAMEVYTSRAWYEMCKRLPLGQRPMPIEVAIAEFRQAFRELSAQVASAGDRTRTTHGEY
jgi:hypothetical protein